VDRQEHDEGDVLITLGIDPGVRRANPTGIAIVESDAPNEVREVFTIKPDSDGDDWLTRVPDIGREIARVITEYKPDLIAFEAPVLVTHRRRDAYGQRVEQQNPESIAPLWALIGILLGAASAAGIPIVRVQPTEVKLALAGSPQADKPAQIHAARLLTGRDMSSHEADAIGIARAGAAKWWTKQMTERMNVQAARTRPGRGRKPKPAPPAFVKDVVTP
jgi:Holliday junction resolvasome RuvABC endonuclease subunit